MRKFFQETIINITYISEMVAHIQKLVYPRIDSRFNGGRSQLLDTILDYIFQIGSNRRQTGKTAL